MKKFVFAFASFAMLLASCTKEVNSDNEKPSVPDVLIYSVTAGLDADTTKATLGEPADNQRKVSWNTGDKICVNGSVSDPLDSSFDGKYSATFTFETNPISSASSYIICYPESVWSDGTHVNLPAVQGDAEGANKALSFPLVGKVDSEEALHNISMKQLCGFIRVKVQGNITLSSMSFTGNNDEQVSGLFTLGWDKGLPVLEAKASPSAAEKTVTANCSADLETGTDKDKYCIIAVPAATYSKGARLSFSTSDNTFDVNSPSSKTIARAAVKNISTLCVVKVASAEDWNTFATNFNNNIYPNYGASTSVYFTSDLDFTDKGIVVMNKSKDFAGTISGNDHSFKNVQLANDAIVGTLAPAGVIKNVKIDSGSKMTMTSEVGSTTYFGPLVGDLQGSIENCESAADMDFLVLSSSSFFIGGLAGRIRGGSMKDCSVSGTLKDIETTNIGNQYAYIGGITSDVNQNPAETQNGSISGCEFSGKILMGPTAGTSSGSTGITSSSGTGFRIGGIVGRAQNGTVADCSTTSASAVDVRGDMIQIYVGGIVGNGQDKITGCTNAAAVSIWSTGTDASGGNAQVGGIAGSNSEEVSGCENTGAINMNAGHRNSFYGGIVGRNTGDVTNCTNSGAITQGTYRPRYMYIGGVLGGNYGTVAEIHNTGDLTVNYVPVNNTMGTTGCGGVIGLNQVDITGNNKIDNTGTVTVNINKDTYLNVSAGGIIGINKASLSGVTNKGKVLSTCSVAVATSSATPYFTAFGGIIGSQQNGATAAAVSECVNDRGAVSAPTEFIYANITSTEASTCMNWCEGGVIGYVYESNLTVQNCTNNAFVYHKANAAATGGRSSFTGGIIGRISATTQPTAVADCENKGRGDIHNYNNNVKITNGPFIGGIVGAAEGASGNNVTIQNCECCDESGAAVDDVYIYLYRGTGGGIAGYTSYVDVKDCNVSKKIAGNANATYYGGMVGQAYNTAISGGTVSSLIGNGKNIGGIASYLGAGASVSASKFAGSIVSASYKYGAVAAVSVAGTTITNAKIGSSATVMGGSASKTDTYVCGDTNATITGTTIE